MDRTDTAARQLDFVMEAALCAAIAGFVLSQSVLIALAALCVTWLAGMAIVTRIAS